MLVLSRKKGEDIRIGNNIEVRVVAIYGDKVRLGIAAPKEVPVHRREVYEAIRREEAKADKRELEKTLEESDRINRTLGITGDKSTSYEKRNEISPQSPTPNQGLQNYGT